MPVTQQTPVVTHDGNGITTVFAYNFKILAAADMEVTVDGVVKTLTTDYSVSGVGSDGGGNVTMVTAPASGTANVVLRRSMAYNRSNDYQDNGDLLAGTADEDADRPILMIQQLAAEISRAMKLPSGVTTDQTLTESAAERIGKLVTFDASGNMALAVSADLSLTTVSAFIATLLDDATAAAARATLGVESAEVDVASAATIDLGAIAGMAARITGTATITSFGTANAGRVVKVRHSDALTLTHNGTSLILPGAANITTAANHTYEAHSLGSGNWVVHAYQKADGTAVVVETSPPLVRQTVLSGTVDPSTGYSAFGGSTGSTTVTATGTGTCTLKATAAAGGDANHTGSITDPSWTDLSTNGTMYLYLDITSAGVVTTGSTTLAPTYQWGGAYSTTNNQHTYNIQEATMKVGDGSPTAAQVYRVFVGEVTVVGNVVNAIIWYALQGRYRSANVAMGAQSTNTNFNHNLGTNVGVEGNLWAVNLTAELGYAVGDIAPISAGDGSAGAQLNPFSITGRNTCNATAGSSGSPWRLPKRSATIGDLAAITLGNWNMFVLLSRRW